METINHECYVSLEVAKLLKEAGFDWKCKAYYKQNGDFILRGYDRDWNATASINPNVEYYSAPILDVTQRWFREVKNIVIYVCPTYEPIGNSADDNWILKWQVTAIHYNIENDEINLGDIEEEIFDTYEEALESGEKKVLKIILKVKNEI